MQNDRSVTGCSMPVECGPLGGIGRTGLLRNGADLCIPALQADSDTQASAIMTATCATCTYGKAAHEPALWIKHSHLLSTCYAVNANARLSCRH